MNNKKIEKLYLIHIAFFILLFVVLNNVYGFNIFEETYEAIDGYKTYMLNEVDLAINEIKNNPDVYGVDEYQLAKYETYNTSVVEQSTYLLYYYMPALYMLVILLLVLIENSIYRSIKFNKLIESYQKDNNKTKEKLRRIIIEKINYKYRRIDLPKHVPYMTVILYISSLLIDNEIILRTINNMVFALAAIITIYGIRIAIKFFRTKSEVARVLVIISNICLSCMVPQMYFIIGFLKSLMTIKVVIKTENKD